jgi:C-terminal processing protease CtpA/Prc
MWNFASARTGVVALAVAVALATFACGSTTDKWTGSVDAVFRYRPSDRSTVVHEIRPGTKSEKAGILPGDRVLAVDGVDVTEMPYGEVRAAMRGPVGTIAMLSIQREGQLIEIKVERRPLNSSAAEQ